MNDELTRRWKAGLQPFDGPVLLLAHEPSPQDVLAALRLVLPRLQRVCSLDVFRNEDWHDHDGYISEARAISWPEVLSWADSIEQLRAACSGDWMAQTLLFPADHSFCLRFWLGEDDETAFDLCAEPVLLTALASEIRNAGIPVTIEPSAKLHFDQAWRG